MMTLRETLDFARVNSLSALMLVHSNKCYGAAFGVSPRVCEADSSGVEADPLLVSRPRSPVGVGLR